jgi:hypothetical protein
MNFSGLLTINLPKLFTSTVKYYNEINKATKINNEIKKLEQHSYCSKTNMTLICYRHLFNSHISQ